MIQKPRETSLFPILPRVPLFFPYDRAVQIRTTFRQKTIGGGIASIKQDTGGVEQGTAHQPQGKRGAMFFQVELTNRASFHLSVGIKGKHGS